MLRNDMCKSGIVNLGGKKRTKSNPHFNAGTKLDMISISLKKT